MTKDHGPWKIKESVIKYKNPWIEVREDKVIRPDGKSGIFGVVNMKHGISVLPMDDEGFVYLTEEFHYAVGEDIIETVSGGIEENEDPLDSAKRELKEELGIEAEEWIDLGVVDPFTSVIKSPARLFLARKLNFNEASPEGTELIKTIKVELDEAIDMIMKNKITHAQSCVLIFKVKEYLDKK